MSDNATRHDPRNLIGDALSMPDLSVAECRSIFFDWAFGLDEPADAPGAARALLKFHGTAAHDHPMLRLLTEAATGPAPRRGRTGRRRMAHREEERGDA